jgi:uncharacterized membrane protein YdjX (TVP38/TMEM64 family)
MKLQTRRIVVVLACLLAAMAGATWARTAYGIEWSPAAMRELVARAGLWGPLVFIVLISLRPILVIPSQVFMISAGICFGTIPGALYAALGITLGGVFTFGFTRWVGRDAVLARMPSGLRSTIENGGRAPALALLFLGVAYPIGPILWFCVAAALTGIALPTFTMAIFAGGFVRAATYTFFGSSLVDAQLHEMLLGGAAIGVVAMLPLLHPRLRARLWRLLRED